MDLFSEKVEVKSEEYRVKKEEEFAVSLSFASHFALFAFPFFISLGYELYVKKVDEESPNSHEPARDEQS